MRATQPPLRDRCAFTLIELLVVVAIIALLLGILLPSLSSARSKARLTYCQANLRSQGSAVLAYATEYRGALPPRYVEAIHFEGTDFLLINHVLADFLGMPFEKPDVGFAAPTGIFRCPEVGVGEQEEERWTHSGYLHHAPNRWLFNRVFSTPDSTQVFADVPGGWEPTHGGGQWRLLERISRQSETVALMDNVNYLEPAHSHREGRESIGYSCEILFDPADELCGDNLGSHEREGQRPAVFVDGHAAALPISREFWQDLPAAYRGPDGSVQSFYEQEVRRLIWFVSAPEPGGGGGD